MWGEGRVHGRVDVVDACLSFPVLFPHNEADFTKQSNC